MLDVFRGGGFDVISLSEAMNNLPLMPTRLTAMGLFADEGIDTTIVAIEVLDGALKLIKNTPRGAPATPVTEGKRTLTDLRITHLVQNGSVLADEVQGIRAFGSTTEKDQVQAKVDRELLQMRNNIAVTVEHLKMGALKGLILDADGSTIYNLYTVFGVAQQTVDMELSTAATDVLLKSIDIAAAIEDALGSYMYTGIHAFCGLDFFKAITSHKSVRQFMLNTGQSQSVIENGFRFNGVLLGNVMWELYRGKVGSTNFVESDEAYAFPLGVPDMFKTYYGPADYVETVNTPGIPYYAKQEMMPFEKGVQFESQSNPLPINKRPRAVIKLGLDSAS